MRNHDRWRDCTPPPSLLHNRPQRRPVKVIEMSMRHQHQVNRREIAQLYSRFAQSLQHKQPAGEVRINHYVLSAHLDEEAGMTNERYAQLSVADQFRFVSLSGARRHRGVLHQPPEGPGTLAKDGVVETGLQHQYTSNLIR